MAFLGGSFTPEATALEALVECLCRHNLGFHDDRGCRRCLCQVNRDDMLLADTARAATEVHEWPRGAIRDLGTRGRREAY